MTEFEKYFYSLIAGHQSGVAALADQLAASPVTRYVNASGGFRSVLTELIRSQQAFAQALGLTENRPRLRLISNRRNTCC